MGELPEDWNERLLRDEHLFGYWRRTKELNGEDTSMSAYALAIANRLVRHYRDDTDAQRLIILRAFYRAHKRPAALMKLRLTLKKAKADAPQPAPAPGKAVIVKLADVQPTTVRWLDPGRIPLGTLTVIDGDPGVGKSTVTLDYAARVSTGRDMPDGTRGALYGTPAGVVLLSGEDDPAATLRPKLDAMGADLDRIVMLDAIRDAQGDRMPNLADLAAVEQAVRQVDANLVVVDPLMAYIPGGKNAHRDQDVRAFLTPLIKLAARLDVALVVVRHLTKQSGEPVRVSALYRGGGSIGIAGAARSVLLVALDPTDETAERRVLARVKGNLGRPPKALMFYLIGPADGVATVLWAGEADEDADDLVQPSVDDERGALDEAVDWLRDRLAGGPVLARKLVSDARRDGIAERTLKRAKARLRIVSEKDGLGSWAWSLPGEPEA